MTGVRDGHGNPAGHQRRSVDPSRLMSIGCSSRSDDCTPDRTTHDDGWGLGLSIVRAIATAHNGTVTGRAREAGGLEIEVRLPAVPEAVRSSDLGGAASGNWRQ